MKKYPEKVLNFALLGCGRFGIHYYRILLTMRGVSLKAVVTADSGNLREVLRDSSIHCVVIATPPKTHFRLARAAILAGKHVLVEKPMVVRVRDAKVLQALVKKSGVTFMVGHQYLYNEDVRRIKKRIDSGNMGKPLYMIADHASSGERKDVDVVWDTAPHALSIFQHFFHPTKIIRASVHKSSDGGFVSADILFDRGPILCMRSAWRAPEKVRKITVVGDKRAAILDETLKGGILKFFNPAYVPPPRTNTPLRAELEHFIACVRGGRKPLTDIEHGLRVVTYLDKIAESIRA